MSNENPFVAPGSDASAPLQPPAVEQPQVPAFGTAPATATIAPGVGQAPYPGPYPVPGGGYGSAGVPVTPPQPLKTRRGLAITTAILSALYAVLCLVAIFVLAHRASLADQVINDPTSVTADQAQSADDNVNLLTLTTFLAFLAAMIVMSVWMRSMRKSFGPTGRYPVVLKEAGYQVFRVVWLASIGLSVFLLGHGSLDTPQAVASHDHMYMVYYGLRTALGLVLVYFAYRFLRVSQRNLTLVQTGYSQDAVNYLSS